MDVLTGLRRSLAAAAACLVAPILVVTGAVADPVRILAVEPAASDSVLVCGVRTDGLPDRPSRETLLSGLPSAMTLAFTLLDERGRDVSGSEAEIRIEPDLWERTYLLRTPASAVRAPSFPELEAMLAHLQPIPVIPLDRLRAGAEYRVRVRLAIQPLATSEIRRARGLLTGDVTEDANRREVSIGLGSLVRFFMGSPDGDTWVTEATSDRFTPATLVKREDD